MLKQNTGGARQVALKNSPDRRFHGQDIQSIQGHKHRSSLFNLWYFIIDYVPAMTHH